MKALLVSAALRASAAGSTASMDGLECAWRQLAVDFAVGLVGLDVAVPVQEALAGSISGDLPSPVHCDYAPSPPAPATLAAAAADPAAGAAWLQADTILHVSPTATAGGDGTAAKPFTLASAKEAVRSIPRAHRPATTVLLASGRYSPGRVCH